MAMTEAIDVGDDAAVLYRLYDKDGVLLYAGITGSPVTRFGDHEREKPWWPDVARKTAALCTSRAEALLAEEKAIRIERPLHNIQLRPPGPASVLPPPAKPAPADGNKKLTLRGLPSLIDQNASLRTQITTLIDALTLAQRELRKARCQHREAEDRCCVRCGEWT